MIELHFSVENQGSLAESLSCPHNKSACGAVQNRIKYKSLFTENDD